MPIRPILLKGHSRPLTRVKFNQDGDLLFTCAKDHQPTVWFSESGERLGTYKGHTGAVYACDVDSQTRRLLTGSADRSCKLWDVKTGSELFSINHSSGVRSVGFSEGEKLFLTVQDSTFSQTPTIFLYDLAEDPSQQSSQPIRSMFVDAEKNNGVGSGKICEALWGPLNKTIVSASDDGIVRVWDVETGEIVASAHDHQKQINSLQFSKDQTMLITSSSDHTAKLYDARTLELLKTYTSDRPLNAAGISPLFNHVIVGGGQEAMNVTVTSAKVGHFEADFYHLVYSEFLGSVKGHFGPINTLAFNPTGKSFATGAEDGYVRLHHFDKEYFNQKNVF